MNKLFDRIFWHNDTTPALNESNLNAMSKGIDDIDTRVVEIASTVMETVPQILNIYEDIEELSENPPYIGANGNWYVWDTSTSAYVDSGVDASITVQIADITMINYGTTPYVTNTGTDTDPIFHLFIPKAATIASVEKTSTSGNIDTYTMTLQDESEFTFEVKNGADGTYPTITASATADATSSANPSVTVTKTGTDDAPNFDFAFSGLKGAKGDTGNTGATGQDGVSPEVTITTITGGHRVTITDADHPSGQSFDVMDGSGSGDMQASVYDSTSAVATAGGIPAYVASHLDGWTASATAQTSGSDVIVVFDDLDNSYGYDLYFADELIGIKSMTKGTGTNTGIKLTYVLDGATSGVSVGYLRILK